MIVAFKYWIDAWFWKLLNSKCYEKPLDQKCRMKIYPTYFLQHSWHTFCFHQLQIQTFLHHLVTGCFKKKISYLLYDLQLKHCLHIRSWMGFSQFLPYVNLLSHKNAFNLQEYALLCQIFKHEPQNSSFEYPAGILSWEPFQSPAPPAPPHFITIKTHEHTVRLPNFVPNKTV